jgi:predicted kinase
MDTKTQTAQRTIQIMEGTLVVLSGLPGSGKSHFRNNRCINASMATWLSTDEMRDQITPPQWLMVDGKRKLRRNETANDAVYAIMRLRVRAGLEMGRTVVVDATNLTDADREEWVAIADELGVPHLVVILDVPLEVCLQRAADRDVHVPADVIRTMSQPPAPELDPKVLAKVRRPDAKVSTTAPQGFQRTSQFNHVVVNDDALLNFTAIELPEGKWDVVGDIHGLLDEFVVLLTSAGWPVVNGRLMPHPEGRRLLLLADLVDRGTQSIDLVRFVKRAVEDGLALCIKGNHEDKLLRFLRTAQKTGIESWSSYANAETGMEMLKLDAKELQELTQFLLKLPPYLVDSQAKVAFVHGDVHAFEPGVSLAGDLVYGMSGWKRMDSDALYQQGVDAGINRYTVIRGHIPATSDQSHIFSLERHPFQRGELVLMRYDNVRDVFGRAESTAEERKAAFQSSLVTLRTEFDFEAYSQRYELLRGLEALTENKAVTRQLDDSKMFRVFKYSKRTFWENSWGTSPLLLKARGIVLDPAGNIVSHPFDKCFNYLENGTGTDLPDDTPVVYVDKLNGFLGIVSGNPLKRSDLLVHTQGGFGGDFVRYIQDFITPATKGQMLKFLGRNDVTLMFEVLHKEDPHIIEYLDEMMGLHLIGVRGKQLTDQPWTEEEVDEAARQMGLRRPKWERMTFGQARDRIRDLRAEGAMVRRDSEQQEFLLKMKAPYYLTTKFLARMGSGKVKYMFANPQDFKKTVDEEFFVIIDAIVEQFTLEQFLAMGDTDRAIKVRALINEMQ